MTPSLFVQPPEVSHLPFMPFFPPIQHIIAHAGDVMQQLPLSANGVSRLSQAAVDAKGSSQSQQVRHRSPLDMDHLLTPRHYLQLRTYLGRKFKVT